MAKSDNVYFYEMGRRVGIDELAKYASMFGMGKKTGIALRGEAPGLVASAEYKKKNFHDEWYLAIRSTRYRPGVPAGYAAPGSHDRQ